MCDVRSQTNLQSDFGIRLLRCLQCTMSHFVDLVSKHMSNISVEFFNENIDNLREIFKYHRLQIATLVYASKLKPLKLC